jgi:hypothetical protein
MNKYMVAYRYPNESPALIADGVYVAEAASSKDAVVQCLFLFPGIRIISIQELLTEDQDNNDNYKRV